MPKATAWHYINAAQHFGTVPKVVEILPPGTVRRKRRAVRPPRDHRL
ncbi:hypothetical protein ACQZ44_10185 [Agrobacterium vitis]